MRGKRTLPRKPQLTKDELNRFFSNLASESSCSSDVSFAKRVYYGLIRVIMKDVRERGYINLPDFGMFYLIEHQGLRLNKSRWSGEKIDLGSQRMLKWKNCTKLKEYMKHMNAKVIW
jgi:nucleoid DNA-binding protein